MQSLEKNKIGKKKILLICGSLNQTTMMHQISYYFSEHDCFFTPYYADGFIDKLAQSGYLDWTILGGAFKINTEDYLKKHNLEIDYQGTRHNYDLVLTCSDLIVPKNIRNKKMVLVQEGMTDPKTIGFYLVKWFKIPRYLGNTATFGLSDFFDKFCVASDGYRDLFIANGVNPEKIVVTGIPNYDNCVKYNNNEFPHRNFVLVATSDTRETMRIENRKKFILDALHIAQGKQVIFKLHPNENFDRAIKEINKWAPGALVYTSGNVHEMIANCDVLITKYSTVVYTGIALGKEVYSWFDLDELKRLSPIQNNGNSAYNIAKVCLELLNDISHKKIYSNGKQNIFVEWNLKEFINQQKAKKNVRKKGIGIKVFKNKPITKKKLKRT